jgi:hypothetical protein
MAIHGIQAESIEADHVKATSQGIPQPWLDDRKLDKKIGMKERVQRKKLRISGPNCKCSGWARGWRIELDLIVRTVVAPMPYARNAQLIIPQKTPHGSEFNQITVLLTE